MNKPPVFFSFLAFEVAGRNRLRIGIQRFRAGGVNGLVVGNDRERR